MSQLVEMEGISHIKGALAHIDYNSIDKSVFEYISFFKRSVYRGEIGDKYSFNPIIKEIVEILMANLNIYPIAYFMNFYKDGNNFAPYHADKYDMKAITVSFGSSRDFFMKNNETGIVTKFLLEHGDIFMFSKQVNDTHKHSIPKRTKLQGERISILFFYMS